MFKYFIDVLFWFYNDIERLQCYYSISLFSQKNFALSLFKSL